MANDDMVDELRRRRQQWMRERDIENERQTLGINNLTPGDLVNQLTDKITSKMPVSNSKQQRIDRSIADELETNTCSICFELMLPKDHSPIILFPCGHTLCKLCIDHHFKTARQKLCPLCRCKVDSHAVNISLQNLVVVFARQKNLEISNHTSQPVASAPETTDYLEQLQMYNLRCKILTDEKLNTERDLEKYRDLCDTQEAVIETLRSEESQIRDRMRRAEDELDLVRKHIRISNEELNKYQNKLQELETSTSLINDTLKSVEREKSKVSALYKIKSNI